MRRVAAFGVLLAAVLTVVFSLRVSANDGTVTAFEDCQTWGAEVSLHNNVSPNFLVTVTTTIPGTTGLSGHFDTRKNPGDVQIWQASGKSPIAGTVTLTISLNGVVHFTRSASISPPLDCKPPPTPTPSPTPRPTATPHETPELTPLPQPTPAGGGRG